MLRVKAVAVVVGRGCFIATTVRMIEGATAITNTCSQNTKHRTDRVRLVPGTNGGMIFDFGAVLEHERKSSAGIVLPF